MKKNLDNFDDLVKNKLDGMDFPFNEANWEKASQMIDATRPAKRNFTNLLLISGILLTGALILGSASYFSTTLNDKTEQNLAQRNSIVSENSAAKNEGGANSQLSALSSTEKIIAVSTNNSSENLIPSGQKNSLETNSTNSGSYKPVTITESLNSSQKAGHNSESGNSIAANSDNSKKAGNNNKAPENTKQSSRNNSNNKGDTHNESNQKSNTGRTASPKQNNAIPENIGAEENARSKNKSPENDLAKEGKPNSENDQQSEEVKELTAEMSPSISLQPDTAKHITATKKDYVKLNHHTILLEAGAINSFGWKANGSRNGNSVSPLIGINYMYNFTSKSSIMLGVQYYSISNLTKSNVSFSVTTFDFGMNNEITTYKITGLQYIMAPVKYIYKLDKNNSIGVGLNICYLINVKNKIETSKTIETGVQTTISRNDNGYGLDQINRYNAQLAISYNYRLSKKLNFNAELNQSLNNVFKDYSYFGVSNKTSQPAAIKLSLTYTLLNK